MDYKRLNNIGIWTAGLGTGLVAYASFADNLRYGKSQTIAAGGIGLILGVIIIFWTRRKKS